MNKCGDEEGDVANVEFFDEEEVGCYINHAAVVIFVLAAGCEQNHLFLFAQFIDQVIIIDLHATDGAGVNGRYEECDHNFLIEHG